MYKRGICLNAVYSDVIDDFHILKKRLDMIEASDTFDAVEFYFEGTEVEYKELGTIMKKSGIYTVFHAGYELKKEKTDIGDTDGIKRAAAIEKVKQLIDTAYILSAKKMLILSGQKPESKEELKIIIDNTISSLKELLSYAKDASKDYTLDIVLEFFNDTGEPFLSIGNLDTVEYICEQVCPLNDNFHITYDTSHVKQLNEDIYTGYDRLKEYVNHVHFSNCVTKHIDDPLYGDKHPPFNIEKGDFSDSDMTLFLEYLEKSGRIDGIDIISYEVISSGSETSDNYYKKIMNSAKTVFG